VGAIGEKGECTRKARRSWGLNENRMGLKNQYGDPPGPLIDQTLVKYTTAITRPAKITAFRTKFPVPRSNLTADESAEPEQSGPSSMDVVRASDKTHQVL
jgi:hypothetical protein